MAKGSNRTTVRIPESLEVKMRAFIEAYNLNERNQESMTTSDFILQAIAEKLSHKRRGGKKKGNIKVYAAEPGFRREVVDSFTHPIWNNLDESVCPS